MINGIKEKLQSQVRNNHISINDLKQNRKYLILEMMLVETKYGLSTKCKIMDTGININSGNNFNIFFY